jgi:hypothetical protein
MFNAKHTAASWKCSVNLKETDMRKGIVTLLAAAGLAIASGTAAARTNIDVGISFGIPAPVYVAPAPVYYPRPVYVEPAPVYYYAPAPVYYERGWIPPGHRKHWKHHHRHHQYDRHYWR